MRQMMKRGYQPIDFSDAIKRRTVPGLRKIAPLGKHPSGITQAIDWTAAVAAAKRRSAGPAERPSNTFGRILKRLLQPRREGAVVQPSRLRFREHDEQRVDARFNGTLAQQLGAKSMDRIDMRFLERLERIFKPLPHRVVLASPRTVLLEPFTQSQLELACRFLCKRHRDDLGHRRATGRENAQDSIAHLGRFAGTSRGSDNQSV